VRRRPTPRPAAAILARQADIALADLDTARRRLFAREGKGSEYDLLSKSLANLLRMWVED
jgi:hypothetical protein